MASITKGSSGTVQQSNVKRSGKKDHKNLQNKNAGRVGGGRGH